MFLDREVILRMLKEARLSLPHSIESRGGDVGTDEKSVKKNEELFIRKILELQRRSKLGQLSSISSSSSSSLLSISLVEIAYRILYPTSQISFPRAALFKCLWISYEKQQINEYLKILNICKNAFQSESNTSSSSSTTVVTSTTSADNLSFLDRLFFQFSFDDKVKLTSTSSSSSDIIKEEIIKMIDLYRKDFYDKLPASQKAYVNLNERIYPISAFALLSEHFQIKIEKIKVMEMFEVSKESLTLTMKKMKEILTSVHYFDSLSEIQTMDSIRKRRISKGSIAALSVEALPPRSSNPDPHGKTLTSDQSSNFTGEGDNRQVNEKSQVSFMVGKSNRKRQYEKFIEGLKREDSSAILVQLEAKPEESTDSIELNAEDRKAAFDSWRKDIMKRRKLMQEQSQSHQSESVLQN